MFGLLARMPSPYCVLMFVQRGRYLLACIVIVATVAFATRAVALDIGGPSGSVHFGTSVTVLPNGNIVVTDPDADSNAYSGVGAVYLYGPGGNLISTITGSQPGDHVGSGYITVLANGNYVIASQQWRNDTVVNAGAVTWASAVTGVSGVVSASNSLVGSTAGDQVGSVTPLSNGNYVVSSSDWDNAAVVDAGAVTWCDGNGGTVGPVSASNSLVGSSTSDNVGYFYPVELSNGNYITSSPNWNDGALVAVGAVTWGNGNGGTVGAVSAANSLVGSSAYDGVGQDGITTLSNGNYVVASTSWSNGATLYVGAVTWANGNGGTVGVVSPANSLVGSEGSDEVGHVIPLSNGNYVVGSPLWHGTLGAATWGNGNGGTVGEVSASNSLVGSSANDRIASGGVVALSNGDYVVDSYNWGGKLGAVAWGNGNGGTVGELSPITSLTGVSTNDYVGIGGIVALPNGNYVVASPYFSNSTGAVTWGYGNGGTTGTVSAANSLVGSTAGDQVGAIVALRNGNFVVSSEVWDDGATADVGAATWMAGGGGTVGPVSIANSLIGSTAGDNVGYAVALSNGDYVVASPYWDNGVVSDAGAVTWGNGNGGSTGTVSASNSLVGSSAGDNVGSGDVIALANGSYVVMSPYWSNGAIVGAGAVTLRRGNDRLGATITAENSVRGGAANAGYYMVFDYDATRDQLVVGRPSENIVTLFKADLLFREGFD